MWNCICVTPLPSVTDILAHLKTLTQCTNDQCYEDIVPIPATQASHMESLVPLLAIVTMLGMIWIPQKSE